MNKSIITMVMLLVLTSCGANTGHQFLAKMSNQEIGSKLVVGKTTKDEVNQMFGNPEDIDMTDNGGETWLYKYVRSEVKAVNFVPVASSFLSGTNDNTKKLKIKFNNCGILEKYAFSNSKGETKVGLFQ